MTFVTDLHCHNELIVRLVTDVMLAAVEWFSSDSMSGLILFYVSYYWGIYRESAAVVCSQYQCRDSCWRLYLQHLTYLTMLPTGLPWETIGENGGSSERRRSATTFTAKQQAHWSKTLPNSELSHYELGFTGAIYQRQGDESAFHGACENRTTCETRALATQETIACDSAESKHVPEWGAGDKHTETTFKQRTISLASTCYSEGQY